MEKSNLKNLKIKTKLKALALSAVTLVTGISCGKSNEVKAPEQESSIIMEAETNTKPNKNTIESTVDNMIKEKGTKETKENNYVENYNYENEENNYVEEETNLETTEAKTENKTEAPSKVYEEEIVIPKKGANKVHSSNPSATTTKIKNSDIKVTTTKSHTQHPTTTKKVTTTQKHTTVKVTTKPVTTTVKVTEPPVVTQPPRTDYNKYDLLSGDPAVAAKAFEKLSSELRDELYSYYIVRGDWGVTNGADQAKVILAILNYNQGISPEALASDEALGKFSKDDLIKSCKEANIPETQYFYESKIDMHKYVIDEDTANYLEDITNKYFDWKNGNQEEMNAELKEYFKNCNAFNTENVDNFNIFYIMERISLNKIGEYEYGGELDTYIEKVIDPLYQSYEPYKGRSYSR